MKKFNYEIWISWKRYYRGRTQWKSSYRKIPRSLEPRDLYSELFYRLKIRQSSRQHRCRGACHISKRSNNFIAQFRGFETLRDFLIGRLIGYWNGTETSLASSSLGSGNHLIRCDDSCIVNVYQHRWHSWPMLIHQIITWVMERETYSLRFFRMWENCSICRCLLIYWHVFLG